MTTYTILIAREPVSLQSSAANKRVYKDDLIAYVQEHIPVRELIGERMYARIVYFHRGRTRTDVDNVIKPTLDAFERLLYQNDRQVVKCVSEKVDIVREDFVIVGDALPGDVYEQLLRMLGDEANPHVLYIEVGTLGLREIVFGVVH